MRRNRGWSELEILVVTHQWKSRPFGIACIVQRYSMSGLGLGWVIGNGMYMGKDWSNTCM